jgi:hypothetical protein
LRGTVTRLSGCLDRLSTVQERVLVLRAGVGAARPHSRRGVARALDLRVQRVRRIERRAIREARALARDGGCGGGGVRTATAGGGGVGGGGGGISGLIAPLSAPATAGGGASADGGNGGAQDQGAVESEAEVNLAPPVDPRGGDRVEPSGLSLAIGIALIVLALLAGFATPHLRARLRSG